MDDEARNLPEPGVKAEKVVPEDGPSVEPGNTLATKRASVATEKAEPVTDNRPAYGFWLAVLALVLVSLVAVAALVIFRTVFENASDVTTVLTALFTVMGTLVGTYFCINTSGDTRDKLQDSIDKAHETANRALAELPPEAGRRVTQEGQQPHGA